MGGGLPGVRECSCDGAAQLTGLDAGGLGCLWSIQAVLGGFLPGFWVSTSVGEACDRLRPARCCMMEDMNSASCHQRAICEAGAGICDLVGQIG